MAAALGMLAGCYKPEMVQIAAPEDVVAPVLEAVEGPIEITSANLGLEKVTFSWSAADYGVLTQVNYSLEVAAAAAPEARVTITSGLTDTTTEVTYETLNGILFNDLGLADGVAEDVLFSVGAKVGEYEKIYSDAVTVSCKVTAAEKEYPKLTVAGSYAYNNWTPGKGQFVFDFEGTDTKYSGVIDFGEDVSALNFKFVGAAWGDNEFSVPSGEAQTPEAAELPLVAGGGDNVSAYTTHRYYSLTLDKAAPKVTKNFSFNSLGVIGDATPTGWDADTDMAFNADKQRFYVDITLIDGTIKFRADDDWAVNWGGADGVLASGADNIPVTAGDYRIYVNLNDPANPTYELNAKMYGKDEPVAGTTPPVEEPEKPEAPVMTGWGLVGTINNWGNLIEDENKYIADTPLVNDGTWYVAKSVEFAEAGEVKIRLDGKWDKSFGLAADVTFAADTELAVTSDNGANIAVPAGTYDIYFNPETAKAWFITDGTYPGGGAAPEASPWALIGEFNSWGGDYPMVIDGEYHKAIGFVQAADGKLKFRKDGQWNYKDESGNEIQTNFGGTFAADAEMVLTAGGSDIVVPAGTYDVYLKVAEDGQSGFAYFMTPGKTPADAGEAEVVVVDYSDCQMELVGSGVAEQAGTSADTAWNWGNVLLASNEGKPAKEGDVFTWTWSNVTLTAEGWKIRTLNAAESGDVANFDLGDGAVDKTASPNAQDSSDGNIYVTAGSYNITLVIDAAKDTKTVKIVAAE